MTARVRFTPLSGVLSDGPLCYLLEVDDCGILLDCGWSDSFPVDDLQPLARQVAQGAVHCVLLSHPDVAHLGALPYLVSKLGLKDDVPIYATGPVKKMGELFMYDARLSAQNEEDFQTFSLDDVDIAFSRIVDLKYSQPQRLTGTGAGITITPYAAGHTLGGTVWKISKDTEEIVYAVDFSLRMDRHLSGTVLETLTRPSLLITDVGKAPSEHTTKTRKDRDKEFCDKVLATLRDGGDVLIPIDTGGRVLEVVLILHQYWQHNKISNYAMVLYNHVARAVLSTARANLEWMNESILKSFETSRDNPFDLRNLIPVQTREALREITQRKVVFASMASLERGNSRDLFVEWAQDPKNLVIFPTSATSSNKEKTELLRPLPPRVMTLQMKRRIPLEGAELAAHSAKQAAAGQAADTAAGGVGAGKDAMAVVEDSDSDSDSDREVVAGAHGAGPSTGGSYDLIVIDGHGSFGGHSKFFKHVETFPMYAFAEKTSAMDEYGEAIRPEEFAFGEIMSDDLVDDRNRRDRHHKPGPGAGMPMLGGSSIPSSAPVAAMEDTEDLSKLNRAEHKPLPVEDVPSRFLVEPVQLRIACGIVHLDYDGLTEQRSVQNIISHIAPRKLIIVHGTETETRELRAYAESKVKDIAGNVYTPTINEPVELAANMSAYEIRLKESLLSSLRFFSVADYEVAYFHGIVERPTLKETPIMQIATSSNGQELGHPAVFIGDVQLSNLRKVLLADGLRAEFMEGGALVVNQAVAVRKNADGALELDGFLSDTYLKVRQHMQGEFRIL